MSEDKPGPDLWPFVEEFFSRRMAEILRALPDDKAEIVAQEFKEGRVRIGVDPLEDGTGDWYAVSETLGEFIRVNVKVPDELTSETP
jgi:hypothetical protein